MTARWLWIAGAIVLDGAAALVGGLLPESWLASRRGALIGFAAGALLAAAFLDILPEALEARGPEALWWAAGSFVVVAVAEWGLVGRSHGQDHHHDQHVQPLALLASDALHNVSDGMAIAAAFVVSVPLGVVTSLAVVVHEVPEEIGDYVVLRAGGMGKRDALLALVGVQATAAIGAIGTLIAATRTARLTGIVMAVAAGTFLFIAATDLLPEVVRRRGAPDARVAMLGFVLGAGLIALQAGW